MLGEEKRNPEIVDDKTVCTIAASHRIEGTFFLTYPVYVPVTVHREQSVKRENTNKMQQF